jgi:pyrimidine-nucleoside phosphorylase
MSKKIAAGANGIVLDVKVGEGAFMETDEEARELASLMVHIGTKMGRKVKAVLSDMSQPLGCAVGNALELAEAVETLHGRGPEDFRDHCLTIASQLLLVGGTVEGLSEARTELEHLLHTRGAWNKFREWIEAQGGDLGVVDDPDQLPSARFVRDLPAPRSGYVAGLNAREIGLTSMLLGGGRAKKGDTIDHAVGVVLQAKVGDQVEKGEPLLTIHANDEGKLSGARQRLLAAYDWSDEPVEAPPLIHEIVG